MSDQSTPLTPTVEQAIGHKIGALRASAGDYWRDGEAFVRREPVQAVVYALAAGYVLRILPLGLILRAITGIGLSLVRPAVVLYGAAKTYEILQRSNRD